MSNTSLHSFHIPVLGLCYSIDTPVKVARFGIASVISIMDDELIEKMRQFHCEQTGRIFKPITKNENDCRARRITAYLNLVQKIVTDQVAEMRSLSFDENNELAKYFEMLPQTSAVKNRYDVMKQLFGGNEKATLQQLLKATIKAGAIDVNIMAKVDKDNYNSGGEILAAEYSDALSALRGFANSNLEAAVVFSAGYNPRLYSYIENFKDFYPDKKNQLKKKIILKVSDYRSALIQGKILAKKGLWVSEFRIESGLNCGGHAFATDGLLLGVIFEEFKSKRQELVTELLALCNKANIEKGNNEFTVTPQLKITGQGGIGTSNENHFLLEHYELDGTGWGSPFLLVPEATNVDEQTLNKLATAKKEDYYMSHASPLGIPFNNFRNSSGEFLKQERIDKQKPGSPCYKKLLAADTEFTSTPICTASRQYQELKIKQLKDKGLSGELFKTACKEITEKECLCEGLGSAVLLKDDITLSHKLSAVTICPGPNLAYFSGIFSLTDMVDHIYGRKNILNSSSRSHMFINELNLYVDYLRNKIEKTLDINPKELKYFQGFKNNLLKGIEYYKNIIPNIKRETSQYLAAMNIELEKTVVVLNQLKLECLPVTPVVQFQHEQADGNLNPGKYFLTNK